METRDPPDSDGRGQVWEPPCRRRSSTNPYRLPRWTIVSRKPNSQRKRPSSAAREFVMERDGWRCVDCGAVIDLTIDHVIPVSRGGTRARRNLQTLCRPCNEAKADS